MVEWLTEPNARQQLERLAEALDSGLVDRVRTMLRGLHPAEIADLLESLPPEKRAIVWELVDPEWDGEVLAELGEDARAALIEEMDTAEIAAAVGSLDPDDQADLLQDLPDVVIKEVLESMDKRDRQRLESVLSYPEDTAGGLMNPDIFTVRPDVTLDVVLRYLRRRGRLPEVSDNLFVANRYDRYLGLLPISQLLLQEPDLTVAEVMDPSTEAIHAEVPARDVARLFQDRNLVSTPVVDDTGTLLGRITIDDVVDVIREQADHTVLSGAGLTEAEDIFAPVGRSARRRAVWLGINLMTAFLAAWVIKGFEGTLSKEVALAVLMPVVASQGGIAGTQTLTLVIRALALGQLVAANTRWFIFKEFGVALLNGLLWALVVAGVAILWYQNLVIGAIIATALVINLIMAAAAGIFIPLILQRLRIDPALAGGVIVTTVTDVVGFMSFLGLATLLIAAGYL